MATDLREIESPIFELIDPKVRSKLSELKDLARSLFGCEPTVTAETDHEIPDDHYLMFCVTVTGTIPEISKKYDEWLEKTLALLGSLVKQIHLFISFK